MTITVANIITLAVAVGGLLAMLKVLFGRPRYITTDEQHYTDDYLYYADEHYR